MGGEHCERRAETHHFGQTLVVAGHHASLLRRASGKRTAGVQSLAVENIEPRGVCFTTGQL